MFAVLQCSKCWLQIDAGEVRFVCVQAGQSGTDEMSCVWFCQKISFCYFELTASANYSMSLIIR